MFDKGKFPTFAVLVGCFTLWGLLNNMTDNLVPAFQKIFTMEQSKAGLVQVAFYGAYAVLAIFASVLVEEFSYRKGLLAGLAVYILGALMYVPACAAQSFDIYFAAIFVVAAGCSLLETTCNPYVLSIGPADTAIRRLNLAQAFNPLGSLAGIFLARELILANLNPAGAEAREAMRAADPAKLEAIVHSELFWVCAPYVGLCAAAGVMWWLIWRQKEAGAEGRTRRKRRTAAVLCASLLPLLAMQAVFPEMDKTLWITLGMAGPLAAVGYMAAYRGAVKGLLAAPRYWCGVVAQFFYVGVQIAVWTWLNVYCQKELGVCAERASAYYFISIVLFVAMRWASVWLMRKMNPAAIMAAFAAAGIGCACGVIWLPADTLFTAWGLPFTGNVACLIGMSGAMSLMFPTIYGMALDGLDPKCVKLGAAGLIMSILGGAVITPWMARALGDPSGWAAKLAAGYPLEWDPELKTCSAALRGSFAVAGLCFAVILAYAVAFGKRKEQAA